MPDRVVSKAKLSPDLVYSSNSFSINRAALNETDSGLNGAKPAAMRSALTKRKVCAPCGKKFLAKVVLPAPLGPAIMIIFLFPRDYLLSENFFIHLQYRFTITNMWVIQNPVSENPIENSHSPSTFFSMAFSNNHFWLTK